MIFSLLKSIFGTYETRTIRRYLKIVEEINSVEKDFQRLSDQELKNKTAELKRRLSTGASPDDLLIEAYAVVKNTCRRLQGTEIHVSGYNQRWDMIPYDVQLIGAIAMHYQTVCEMQTGEGKTLTAAMPAYLHALTGKGVHIATGNEYLVKRDCEWIGEIFRWHGLKVGALSQEDSPEEKKQLYECDILYGTASEFGFDYLRDNSMAQSLEDQCQRKHYFAIVDEADSILIDEARTPLIISGPSSESKHLYHELKDHVSDLVSLQRDFCNQLAGKARAVLERFGLFSDEPKEQKWSKEELKERREAVKDLYIVSKGLPTNKILKRAKESPDLRALLEDLETEYHGEHMVEEKNQALSALYIIIDERSSDFELTDKGIQSWKGGEEDFLLLDLVDEYLKIDSDPSLTNEEKFEKKIACRTEDAKRKERAHNLRQLFRAHLMMEKDVDYIIQEGKIVIIDEHTGRAQPGRRFSDGLHQAIEAKEGVAIQRETQTYATITLQNYFRMYERLAGMTGTAMTESAEFKHIYRLDVLPIPTNRPCRRLDHDDEVYMTEREKYQAILKEVQELHAKGVPILIGTDTVEASEKLSRILRANQLHHTVLNAKQHEKEAEIIAHAGEKGAITVATNMAGRGTDIKLGEGVEALGGLFVIGTTRHQSRRIDRQLRGRSGRQGDRGASKFYISFEDPLMRRFSSPRINRFLQRHRPPEGEKITGYIVNRSIETAQKRLEQRNYAIRKHTLEYDDVMNRQRQEVYTFRNELLSTPSPIIMGGRIVERMIALIIQRECRGFKQVTKEEIKPLEESLATCFPFRLNLELKKSTIELKELEAFLLQPLFSLYKQKLDHEAKVIALIQKASNRPLAPIPVLANVLRGLFIRTVDRYWQMHLLSIDHLRQEVSLRAIAQKDPLVEFKQEAFTLFDQFRETLYKEIIRGIFSLQMVLPNSDELLESVKKIPVQEIPSFVNELELSSPGI